MDVFVCEREREIIYLAQHDLRMAMKLRRACSGQAVPEGMHEHNVDML